MVSSQTSVAEHVGAPPKLGRPRVPTPSRSTDARRGYGIVVLIIVLLIGMFVSAAVGIRAIPLASTWDAVFSFGPPTPITFWCATSECPVLCCRDSSVCVWEWQGP